MRKPELKKHRFSLYLALFLRGSLPIDHVPRTGNCLGNWLSCLCGRRRQQKLCSKTWTNCCCGGESGWPGTYYYLFFFLLFVILLIVFGSAFSAPPDPGLLDRVLFCGNVPLDVRYGRYKRICSYYQDQPLLLIYFVLSAITPSVL